MKNFSIVMQIARAIRREAEVMHCEWGNNPKDNDLIGWCAHSSNILFQELLKRGIQSKLVYNDLHCFVTYGPYIIDITATQFGRYNKVEVRPRQISNIVRTNWWNEDLRISNAQQYKNGRGWANHFRDDNYHDDWYARARKRVAALRIR